MPSMIRSFKSFGLSLLTATSVLLSPHIMADEHAKKSQRIISIGGSVTEIVYALGQEDRLVARDTTSSYPAEANKLPNVGYMRSLSPEGVLSVEPDLIIAEEGSGPKETIDVLKEASVTFTEIPDGFDREAVVAKILAVGDALGEQQASANLADTVNTKLLDAAKKASAHQGDAKRVLFILSTRSGRIMASGANTAADGIIKLAGGVNAMTAFDGYKPVTDEAVISAAPDVILMMARRGDGGSDHDKADDELFNMPAISTTPAAKTKRVIRINGLLLLGFGPRTADAITTLNDALYDQVTH